MKLERFYATLPQLGAGLLVRGERPAIPLGDFLACRCYSDLIYGIGMDRGRPYATNLAQHFDDPVTQRLRVCRVAI